MQKENKIAMFTYRREVRHFLDTIPMLRNPTEVSRAKISIVQMASWSKIHQAFFGFIWHGFDNCMQSWFGLTAILVLKLERKHGIWLKHSKARHDESYLEKMKKS
ncbi:unnamed protein product [Vicia faba]|uniref:Uncharacterized protein n=1 Tax=Vicia faba TaxID=3906 RepID=A0AAV1AMH4_VICFA|nr:unnamed protein product [Vicia faba]